MKESEFIDKLRLRFNPGAQPGGIGDDCAVLAGPDGNDILVSTDMLMEGVHFRSGRFSPYDIGWKAAAVNWSDIAAMGGTPVGSFLSLALPSGLDESWADSFLEGFGAVCDAPVLGGDTIRSSSGLCVNVTVLGKIARGKALLRSGARPGDIIYVSGALGDSAAALKLLEAGENIPAGCETLLERHLRPIPRLEEGAALASSCGVHAMMDISDGVGSDLRKMLTSSGVGAEVEVAKVPLSDGLRRLCFERGWSGTELALCGGEDFELLFTADPSVKPEIPCFAIGRIVEGDGVKWTGGEKDYKGFEHF